MYNICIVAAGFFVGSVKNCIEQDVMWLGGGGLVLHLFFFCLGDIVTKGCKYCIFV